uniref:BZIP domain-containing protein n=1 Tax=Meloidogyne floridensis TaxID=298350 RepID=A0A915NJA4_9BILA
MKKSNSHFTSKQKIGLSREKCELLNDCDNIYNNQAFADYTSNNLLRRSLNFSNENNFGCILPTISKNNNNSSLNNNEIQNFIATEIPLIFSSSTPETSSNNSSTLQKSERSAFSVIRAGSLVGNDKQKEASPSPSTTSIPPQLPPIPLELQSSLNPYISSLSTSPFFFPFHSNSQQLEFIRLASQLANGMTKTQWHSLDTQSPSQINQFSQPLTLDTSEPTTQKHLENFTQNELRHEEAQEIPLDFSVIKHGIKKHLTKNKTKSVICTSSTNELEESSTCYKHKACEQPLPLTTPIPGNIPPPTELPHPSLVFPERKTVLEITGPPIPSSSINSQQTSFPSFSSQQLCCQHGKQQQQQTNPSSSIFRPLANFLLSKSEQKHHYLTGLLNPIEPQLNSKISEEKGKVDEQYMDRRRRNNEAAKRCRANRRAVFEYRSRRAQLLEAENGELRQEMIKLNNELEQLKALIAANAVAASQESSPSQQNQRLMHKA